MGRRFILTDYEDELRSTLEDWIFVGLKMVHPRPVIADINLNKELRMMLREVDDGIMGHKITADEWNRL